MRKLKAVCRILGWLLLALAVLAMGAEAVASLQAGAWHPIPLGQVWYNLDRESLNLIQAIVQRYLHPAIWDPGITALLQWPTWLVALIPGVVLLLLGRKQRRRRSFR